MRSYIDTARNSCSSATTARSRSCSECSSPRCCPTTLPSPRVPYALVRIVQQQQNQIESAQQRRGDRRVHRQILRDVVLSPRVARRDNHGSRIERGHNPGLRHRESLLLHCLDVSAFPSSHFVDGRSVVFADRIEVVDAAHAAIAQHQRSSLQHPFSAVLHRGARQARATSQRLLFAYLVVPNPVVITLRIATRFAKRRSWLFPVELSPTMRMWLWPRTGFFSEDRSETPPMRMSSMLSFTLIHSIKKKGKRGRGRRGRDRNCSPGCFGPETGVSGSCNSIPSISGTSESSLPSSSLPHRLPSVKNRSLSLSPTNRTDKPTTIINTSHFWSRVSGFQRCRTIPVITISSPAYFSLGSAENKLCSNQPGRLIE